MEISFSALADMPIFGIEDGRRLGFTKQPLVNFDTGAVLAITVKKGLFGKSLVLPTSAIREISEGSVLVDSGESLSEEGDIVRLQDILGAKIALAGSRVITETGTYLGRVSEAYAETWGFKLSRIEVTGRPFFKNFPPLSITADKIVKVTRSVVIVKDQTIAAAAAEKTAPAAVSP